MTYENKSGYPSYSNIVDRYIDKSWFTDEHRHRGQEVHAWIRSYLQGLFYPIEKQYQGYCDSAAWYIEKYVDRIHLIEERLVDKKLKYSGQLDLVFSFKNDETHIVTDWKTSTGLYESWSLQDAAYRNLYIKKIFELNRGQSIRLKKDGSKPIINEHTEFEYYFEIFKAHTILYHYYNTKSN